MKLYVSSVDDVSPNALRSTFNPTRYYLSTTACKNLDGYTVTQGDCGCYRDHDRTALGVIDTDHEGWEEALVEIVGHVAVDADDIKEWVRKGQAGEIEESDGDYDFEFPQIRKRETKAWTWNELSKQEESFPTPRDGWEALAYYTDPNGWYVAGLDDGDFDDLVSEITGALDDAHIEYDHQVHNTSNETQWEVIAVKTNDIQKATDALKAAVKVAVKEEEDA